MYRFTRSITVKLAADMPGALQFGNEVTAYLNKTYNMKINVGVELFGRARVHWSYDVASLDEVSQLNTSLMQDRSYWGIVEKAKHLWVEGSMNDRVVKLIG